MHKGGLIGTMFSAVLHENVIPGSFWYRLRPSFLTLPWQKACAQIRAALHDHLPTRPRSGWEQAKHLKTAEEFRFPCRHDTGKASAVDVCAQRPHLPE